MKREMIKIETHLGPRKVVAYQVKGHIYTHRNPFNDHWWGLTHKPTGFAIFAVDMRTRRKAVAVGLEMARRVPELSDKARIKTFIRKNRKQIFGHMRIAVLMPDLGS